MPLPITSLYGGISALILLWLAFRVVGRRREAKIGLADGGDKDLTRLMRGHANAAETIPITLILLGLAEGLGTPGWLLHLLGAAFCLARLSHALHFTRWLLSMRFRTLGAGVSFAVMTILALDLIVHGLIAIF